MLTRIQDATVSNAASAGTVTSDPINLEAARTLSIQCVITTATYSAKAFAADTDVNATTNVITAASHGYITGVVGQLTSTGTLPGGLATSTNYYVIVVTSGSIKLASSYANAVAGTAIDITNNGSAGATHTFTPTTLGGSVTLQKSNDKTNWSDDGSATSITTSATVWFEKIDPSHHWARFVYAVTGGSIASENTVVVKG